MKKIIAIFLLSLVLWTPLKAQMSVTDRTFILQNDTITVDEGFELLEKLSKGTLKDMLFIHNGKMYFRFAINMHRIRRTYLIDGNKMRRI